MADKKMVEEITSMDVDFAQWYTDVVKKAELIDYTSVKGCGEKSGVDRLLQCKGLYGDQACGLCALGVDSEASGSAF